jgi:type II secretory pathway predicted ATPase ExeA
MDRNWAGTRGMSDLSRHPSSGDFVLPSRCGAIERLRAALWSAQGPALVTGEPGAGKTWLWHRLQSEMATPWRWVCVDQTPATDATEFFRLIGYGLGLTAPSGLGESRRELSDFLRERTADGERWILVVEEAQNLSISVSEEVRVLANRLGRPAGFSGLILVGQTALSRRLTTRPLAPLAARLAAQVHLRPIDLEEASALLGRLRGGRSWEGEPLERLHRDTGGNPRRLLLAAAAESDALVSDATPSEDQTPLVPPSQRIPARENPSALAWQSPAIGGSKPPLKVEEGMIEVGWEPPVTSDPEPLASAAAGSQPRSEQGEGSSMVAASSDEAVVDHYAAIQAGNEWAENQGRIAASGPVQPPLEEDAPLPWTNPPAKVRAEAEHAFAPYSQLFSRLKPSTDAR